MANPGPNEQQFSDNSPIPDKKIIRRAAHPCPLRLKTEAFVSVSTSLSLVSAGYASVAMGLFTLFRITPALLFCLAYLYKTNASLIFNKVILYILLSTWLGLVLFVLFILGFVLIASTRITNRSVLLLHPWGLLLLYIDMFVYIALTLYMHYDILTHPNLNPIDRVYHPIVFFSVMYAECVILGVLYYLYATYFIAAELTVIENFF